MKVLVASKHQFEAAMQNKGITDENVASKDQVMLISINGSEWDKLDDPDVKPYFKKDHANVLNLIFDDIEETEHEDIKREIADKKITLFSEEQAKQIIAFIERNKDKRSCLVHCAAGISRSGAVGEFISSYFGEDYKEFKQNNPRIMPNGYVLSTLRRVLRESM